MSQTISTSLGTIKFKPVFIYLAALGFIIVGVGKVLNSLNQSNDYFFFENQWLGVVGYALIAIGAVAASQAAIGWTLEYVLQRQVFGQAVAAFQHTRFTLAELQTEVQIAQVFVDKCTELLLQDKLDTVTASMAKYWCTDLQCKVMDACVQLHGGNGFMWEYPITRAYADARVQRIYGGTNEIMKEVIARSFVK